MGDSKIFKILYRTWFNPKVDKSLLSLFMPPGLVLLLGVGLHVYKKHLDWINKIYAGVLAPLFEHMARSGGGDGNWFKKFKLAKLITFTSCLLIAYKQRCRDDRLQMMHFRFPDNKAVATLVMLFEFHLPLSCAYQGAIRLASSRKDGADGQADRDQAFAMLVDDLLPSMVVACRLLGSHEYAKLLMTYLVLINHWQHTRPDLIQILLANLGACLNEEPIELIHAHVAQRFLAVTMGVADYLQASFAFLSRGPFLLLYKVFGALSGSGGESRTFQNTGAPIGGMEKDVAAAGAALDELFAKVFCEAEYEEALRAQNDVAGTAAACGNSKWQRFQAQTQSGKQYSPTLGIITLANMVGCRRVDKLLQEIETKARQDLVHDRNADDINSFLQHVVTKYYDQKSGWRYSEMTECVHHFHGAQIFDAATARGQSTQIFRTADAETRRVAQHAAARKSKVVVKMSDNVDTLLRKLMQSLNLGSLNDIEPGSVNSDQEEDNTDTDPLEVCEERDADVEELERSEEELYQEIDHLISNSGESDREGAKDVAEDVYFDTSVTMRVLDSRMFPTGTVRVKIGADQQSTLNSILSSVNDGFCARIQHVAWIRDIEVGSNTYRGDLNQAVHELHLQIRDCIQSKFKQSVLALLHRNPEQAIDLTQSIVGARPAHSHDVHTAFTNQAYGLTIRAVAFTMLSVGKYRQYSHGTGLLLQEAKHVLELALEGSTKCDGVETLWINRHQRAGANMYANIEQAIEIVETLMSQVS